MVNWTPNIFTNLDEKGNEIGRIDYNVRQPQMPEGTSFSIKT